MDTREAAERFVRVWERAWAAHDVDALLELYAEECVHRSMPFREPHRGRGELAGYLRWSFAQERVTDVRGRRRNSARSALSQAKGGMATFQSTR